VFVAGLLFILWAMERGGDYYDEKIHSRVARRKPRVVSVRYPTEKDSPFTQTEVFEEPGGTYVVATDQTEIDIPIPPEATEEELRRIKDDVERGEVYMNQMMQYMREENFENPDETDLRIWSYWYGRYKVVLRYHTNPELDWFDKPKAFVHQKMADDAVDPNYPGPFKHPKMNQYLKGVAEELELLRSIHTGGQPPKSKQKTTKKTPASAGGRRT
jgi:hypothetical protein